jgi:glycosyltransferase involved in cell wall biosynthesis
MVAAPRLRAKDEIVATFVGGHFFRKGGLALLHAFQRLRRHGSNMRLNVVSSMQLCGWRDQFATPAVRREAMNILESTPGITYWKRLPAPDVMRLLQDSDIGVLPSYGETYGYSILEAMAHGCAAVVPGVSPFTEFVSDDSGILLETPVTRADGFVSMDFGVGHEQLHQCLVESLVSALGRLENNPPGLRQKGIAALQRISDHHCPLRAAAYLEEVYRKTFAERA